LSTKEKQKLGKIIGFSPLALLEYMDNIQYRMVRGFDVDIISQAIDDDFNDIPAQVYTFNIYCKFSNFSLN